MSGEPDPRFLGGQKGMVVTDTSQQALVVSLGWDGGCDIVCNVSNEQAIKSLREVIAHIESKPSNVTPFPTDGDAS